MLHRTFDVEVIGVFNKSSRQGEGMNPTSGGIRAPTTTNEATQYTQPRSEFTSALCTLWC